MHILEERNNMAKKKTRLQLAQESAQAAINETNGRIEVLGSNTSALYDSLTAIQDIFDKIRNVPTEKRLEYEEYKAIRINWKQQAEKIEKDYREAAIAKAGVGAAGAGLGVAVVTMGPTVAMGVATTFGVASTGTAISALSGAAATNAALAWLGGGALAAGGGGMAAGEAFLALAGPVGWAIAGVALLTSGVFIWKANNDKKHLESVFVTISERDVKSYSLAIVELNERIKRIEDENVRLMAAIEKINTFGLDYSTMTEAQQYELGAYVNLMTSSTQLLVNPILGLQPKYAEIDYEKYVAWDARTVSDDICISYKAMIISLSNLLYRIDVNERDQKLLWKSFKGNKKMLEAMNMKKKEFKFDVFEAVMEALKYKYGEL